MMLQLVKPKLSHRAEAEAFKKAFFEAGENVINGSSLWDTVADYAEWLTLAEQNSHPETVSAGWVSADVYFAMEGSKIVGSPLCTEGAPSNVAPLIVGIIDLRHRLNDFLRDLGHCGFSVRPSERRKGYASAMLALILPRAKALGLEGLQLSCLKSNEASRRTILKNGGVFQRGFLYEGEKAEVYLIPS